jgi:hypothetical protein
VLGEREAVAVTADAPAAEEAEAVPAATEEDES